MSKNKGVELPTAEIIRLYTEEKVSVKSIARKFSTYCEKISQILKKNNIPIRKSFCELHKDEIISYIKEGYNTVQIAKKLGKPHCFYKAISRFMKRNGFTPTGRRFKTPENMISEMISMYNSGLTCLQISQTNPEVYGDESNVQRMLKKNNVKMRRRGIISYTKNPHYFDSIDSERKAYFLGLLMADGNLYGNTLSLTLIEPDKYLLEELAKDLECHTKLDFRESKENDISVHNRYTLKAADITLAESVKKQGIVPRKTGKECIPDSIPDELLRHFLRGYFDGDGTVFVSSKGKYLRFGYYAPHNICQEILNILGFDNKVYDKESISFFLIQKREKVLQFYHYIYDDASIFMKRKKEKFDTYM